MQISGKRRIRERGSSMIEFGICFPVLALLLFGTADFGRLFYTSIEVANAAASGANFGSLNTTNSTNTTGIATAAQNDAANLSNLAVSSSVVCQDSSGNTVTCATSGAYQYVKVTVTRTFQTLFNYQLVPSSVALSKTVMMRVK